MFETERSMRSPLGRVRGLGSAKHGTEHFWQQRVTSVALVFLSFFLVALVIGLVGRSHATVVMVIGHPVIATLLVGVAIASGKGLMHMEQVQLQMALPVFTMPTLSWAALFGRSRMCPIDACTSYPEPR